MSGVSFILAGFTLGPILVRWGLRFLHWLNCIHFIVISAFGYLLVLAQITHEVGLDMIIGAYAAGVAFSAVEEREQIESGLKPITDLFHLSFLF
nr:cation:proton antiporter [Desulfopila sp. IMCC35008]